MRRHSAELGNFMKDPVCGMDVDPKKAFKATKKGKTYLFCSLVCKNVFMEGDGKASETTKKDVFLVTGMHCASCAGAIERALYRINGVIKADVNFATETATVEYSSKVKPDLLVKAVERTGYKLTIRTEQPVIVPGTEQVILRVIGMDNPHCVGTISNAINVMPGIISKELYVNQNAFIKFDPNLTDIEKIKKAVRNAGYEAVDVSGSSSTSLNMSSIESKAFASS